MSTEIGRDWWHVLRPPPDLTVSQWADAHRRLSPEASAEPGRWNTDRAEYQRGIMDAVSDPEVTTVVVMSSAQVGKTEIILNMLGYCIDQDPCPILLVMPTVSLAEAFSKKRLAPMLRDTPTLEGKVSSPKSRETTNTILSKDFPGGSVSLVGANAPSDLSSRPIRVVLCDEVDRFPPSAGSEGDPVSLAAKRSTTFWNRKIILTSTPTTTGLSRIEAAYEESDQRHFEVPCWSCGSYQRLTWQQVRWDNRDPETARYVCEHCEAAWSDAQRWDAVSRGHWRAAGEFAGTAGFRLNELCSPWVRLAETVRAFLDAKDSPERLRTWVNTALGETWQERGEAPDWQRLYDRREPYRGVADGVALLTAGADIQQDRIECSIWGWGRGRESWLVEHRVLAGDTARPEVWQSLTALIGEAWAHPSGAVLTLAKIAVDSGYAATEVYSWARTQPSSRVMVIKGQDRSDFLIGTPAPIDVTGMGKKLAHGLRVWPVGSSALKRELYDALRLDRPTEADEPYPPGYVHLPDSVTPEYLKQLTAEHLVTKTIKGYRRTEWQKLRDRNEALDCRVYARAAATLCGIDRFNDSDWRRIEISLGVEARPDPSPEPVPQQRPRFRVRKSKFMDAYGR